VISLTRLGKTDSTFAYDARGNQVNRLLGTTTTADRTIKYTLWDQAHEITRGTRQSRFWYGDGGARFKREDLTVGTPGTTTKTLQVGNVEIVSGPSGAYKRRYLAGVMYQQLTTDAQGATVAVNTYLHHDHLGNIVAVTNASGAVQERLGYSAFGNRISLTKLGATSVSNNTRRGFTGHEQFELLNIVHMNGRIYDPTLGRFLQVDPVVQDPSNGQNYNRYTYVWNNPLAYTDPTGMISVKNLVRKIVGIYVSAYLGSSTNIFGSMAGGTFANSVGSLVGSYIAGGKGNIGLSGAFGFASAGSSNEVKFGERSEEDFSGEAEDSSAYAVAYGDNRYLSPPVGKYGPVLSDAQMLQMTRDYKALLPLFDLLVGKTPLEVANEFARVALPFTLKWGYEIGANIVVGAKQLVLDDVRLGDYTGVTIVPNVLAVADVHTHPKWGGDGFSGGVRYTAGDKKPKYFGGDIHTSWDRGNIQDSYAFRAGGGAWHFRAGVYRKDFEAAVKADRTISDTWSSYTERIR
jgi:RHS repeat-associated protein